MQNLAVIQRYSSDVDTGVGIPKSHLTDYDTECNSFMRLPVFDILENMATVQGDLKKQG